MPRRKKRDLTFIDRIPIDQDPALLEPRIRMLLCYRDIRFFDRHIIKHDGDNALTLYQLKAAAPLIYLQRDKLKNFIEGWMRQQGDFSQDEIDAWSMPRFEWPEEKLTKKQEEVLWHWRKKYKITDRTDWMKGILIPQKERDKLDNYRQASIIQPRQSGKSEVVVRVNIYIETICQNFDSGVFAPTEKQAKEYIFARTISYVKENPAYKGRFEQINALSLRLRKPPEASGSSFSAHSASPGANIEGDSLDWAIIDEAQDVTDFKIKKSIKYMMAAKKGSMIKIGTVNEIKGHFYDSTTKKGEKYWHQIINHPDIVAACRPDWADFIAKEIEQEGRDAPTVKMAVFLEWMLESGMFITEDKWDSLTDPDLDYIEYDKEGIQFASIDVARVKDETIVMVGKVDTKQEYAGRHPLTVINTKTWKGTDYDTQFEEIKGWLDANYNIAAIGIDNTGERGGIGARFEKTSYRVELFDYSRPGKSEWYTNLRTMINAHYTAIMTGRYHEALLNVPGSDQAKSEKRHENFAEQMMSLIAKYVGKYLVVEHPDIEGAHDDYPDALMQLAWMASRVHISLGDLEEAVEQMGETTMDKADWTQDLFESNQSKKQKKRRTSAKSKKKDTIGSILRNADSLDSPKW